MDLMARIKRMWGRHDERLADEAVEARAAGVEDDLSTQPGLDRVIEEHAAREHDVAEHDEPA